MYALNPRNHINSKKNPQLSILSYYIALKLYDLGFFLIAKTIIIQKRKKGSVFRVGNKIEIFFMMYCIKLYRYMYLIL